MPVATIQRARNKSDLSAYGRPTRHEVTPAGRQLLNLYGVIMVNGNDIEENAQLSS